MGYLQGGTSKTKALGSGRLNAFKRRGERVKAALPICMRSVTLSPWR